MPDMAMSLVGSAISGLGSMGAAWMNSRTADRQARNSRDAADLSYSRYSDQIRQGLDGSADLYQQGQNALAPYMQAGQRGLGVLEDITGTNGTGGQANALAMYRGNPSSTLLGTAREDAIRRTIGSASAAGLSNAGSTTESLGRRLGDMDLADFYKWRETPLSLAAMGQKSSDTSAALGGQRAGQILGAHSALGAAGAGSTMMGANATNAALGSSTTGWANALGNISTGFGNNLQAYMNRRPAGVDLRAHI
jgi:hypothetical protein